MKTLCSVAALTGINLGLTLTAIRTLEARLVEVKV